MEEEEPTTWTWSEGSSFKITQVRGAISDENQTFLLSVGASTWTSVKWTSHRHAEVQVDSEVLGAHGVGKCDDVSELGCCIDRGFGVFMDLTSGWD